MTNVNKSKTREVVFYDNRRRHCIQPPPPLPDITRESTLKVLGVTFTSTLSASDHVRRVISGSAQSLYALRVLRHHGLGEDGLRTVFRAVVVSRLIYAASAWIGFITGRLQISSGLYDILVSIASLGSGHLG